MAVRKRMIQKDGSMPTLARYEILDRINRIDSANTLRDRALVAFLYLTGARIEEVCRLTIGKKKGKPIIKKQIEFSEDYLVVNNVRTLKRRKAFNRNIPVIIAEREQKFIDILNTYLNTLSPEQELFPISRQRAYQILEAVNLFPHYLRHLRNTHLVVDYGFNTSHLKQFNGWSSSRTADNYVHLNIDDLINKMKNKK